MTRPTPMRSDILNEVPVVGPPDPPTALPVGDRIQIDMMDLRKDIAKQITTVFVRVNIYILSGLGIIYVSEIILLYTGHVAPNDRIIDSTVIKTLIGATTVQLGAIALSMAR